MAGPDGYTGGIAGSGDVLSGACRDALWRHREPCLSSSLKKGGFFDVKSKDEGLWKLEEMDLLPRQRLGAHGVGPGMAEIWSSPCEAFGDARPWGSRAGELMRRRLNAARVRECERPPSAQGIGSWTDLSGLG